MASAQIVATWIEGTQVFVAARVEGDTTDHDGKPAAVEYVVSVPADVLIGVTHPRERMNLVANAIKAERGRSRKTDASTAPYAGLTGIITV